MPAYCLLLYRFADVMRLAALGNQEHDWEVHMDYGMAFSFVWVPDTADFGI